MATPIDCSNPSDPTILAIETIHDATNVLTRVVMMLDHAYRNPGDRETILAALQSAQHCAGFFRSALKMVKAQVGTFVSEQKEFCLGEMLQALEQMFGWSMKHATITFAIECPKPIAEAKLKGDPQLLFQILINLVDNAFKFTAFHRRKGDGEITVRVREPSTGVYQFVIEDNGPGMCEETKARLGEAFFQGGETAADGFGLGMRICHKFAQLLGAFVRVESEVNGGTKFVVSVPLEAVASEQQTPAEQVLGADIKVPVRVLVVDDDPVSTLLLGRQITAFGALTDVAGSCEQARAFFRNGDYGVIIVDNRLPDGVGLQLIEELRLLTDRGGTKPLIVSCSASLTTDEADAYRAAGVHLFLPKPIEPELVLELIIDCQAENGHTQAAA